MDDQTKPGAITWQGASVVGAAVLAVASGLSVYFLEARNVRLMITEMRADLQDQIDYVAMKERDQADDARLRFQRQRDNDARLFFERIQKNQGDIYAAIEVGRVRWEHQKEMDELFTAAILTLEQGACKAEVQSESKDN